MARKEIFDKRYRMWLMNSKLNWLHPHMSLVS